MVRSVVNAIRAGSGLLTGVAVRQLYLSSKPVYEKRAQVIAQIPGFWSAVFQNAPTDIETYIQGDVDASALQHLTSLEVSRFELDDDPQNGEPRSLQFIFRFEMNDFFEDQVLVKKFWHRRSKAGWSGLVSEPVRIRRKKGRDLTNGLLDLAVEVHEQEQSMQNKSLAPSKDKAQTQPTKARQQLMVKLEEWPSFERSVFTWFGFRGKHLSADESSRIIEDDEKPSAQSIAGEVEAKESNLETNNDQALPSYSALNEGHVSSIEIFSPGEEFAVSLSEDLYPEATKYFGTTSLVTMPIQC